MELAEARALVNDKTDAVAGIQQVAPEIGL